MKDTLNKIFLTSLVVDVIMVAWNYVLGIATPRRSFHSIKDGISILILLLSTLVSVVTLVALIWV